MLGQYSANSYLANHGSLSSDASDKKRTKREVSLKNLMLQHVGVSHHDVSKMDAGVEVMRDSVEWQRSSEPDFLHGHMQPMLESDYVDTNAELVRVPIPLSAGAPTKEGSRSPTSETAFGKNNTETQEEPGHHMMSMSDHVQSLTSTNGAQAAQASSFQHLKSFTSNHAKV